MKKVMFGILIVVCQACFAMAQVDHEFRMISETNVMIPMRNGAGLATDIYRPGSGGKFPVVLVRTPYGTDNTYVAGVGEFYVKNGYIFAIQDCRGRFSSEGDWFGKRNEANDSNDSITWLGTRDWSTGAVGMVGASYLGIVQWMVACSQNPYLKALVPIVAPITLGRSDGDYRKLASYCNNNSGSGSSALLELSWLLMVNGRTISKESMQDIVKFAQHLPLADIPKQIGVDIPGWERFLETENGHWEAYMKRAAEGNWDGPLGEFPDYRKLYEKVNIPILQISGWFDCSSDQSLYNYRMVKQYTARKKSHDNQKVIIGPWPHHVEIGRKVGQFDFGEKSVIKTDAVAVKWFDRWLKGIQNGIDKEPPVKIFVMGRNEWRETTSWPVPGTQFTPYYFHSSGNANESPGNGFLNCIPPKVEPPDSYTYDPANPTPTLVQPNQIFNNAALTVMGPIDMRPVEERSDVLIYTSDVLDNNLEITGPLNVVLYISTDAPSTHFFVRLLDVFPDGASYSLFYSYANPYSTRGLEPVGQNEDGQPVLKCDIELPPTGNLFLKGHKIRIEVCSSSYPLFRSLNSDSNIAYLTEFKVAHQTIYHNRPYPSHVVLPVIPGDK